MTEHTQRSLDKLKALTEKTPTTQQRFDDLVAQAEKGAAIEADWRQLAQLGKWLLIDPSITDEQKTELGQRIYWAESHFSEPSRKLEFIVDLLAALGIQPGVNAWAAFRCLHDQLSDSQRENLLTAVRIRRQLVNQEFIGDAVLADMTRRVMLGECVDPKCSDQRHKNGLHYKKSKSFTAACAEVGEFYSLGGRAVQKRLEKFNSHKWDEFKEKHLQKRPKRSK